MHVHGARLDPGLTNLYSALANAKAAAARSAAAVRKKLLSSTGEVEDELDNEAVLHITMNQKQESRQPPEQKRQPSTPPNSADESTAPDDPTSFWG